MVASSNLPQGWEKTSLKTFSAVRTARRNTLESGRIKPDSPFKSLVHYWHQLQGLSLACDGDDLFYVVDQKILADKMAQALNGGLQS